MKYFRDTLILNPTEKSTDSFQQLLKSITGRVNKFMHSK